LLSGSTIFIYQELHVPHIIMDHDVINIEIKLLKDDIKETGPGFWKCNVTVLNDKYFQDDFCSL